MRKFLALVLLVGLNLSSPATALETQSGNIQVTRMSSGFKTPWALGFLPDGSYLVTERRGRLYHVELSGKKTAIKGVPKVAANGQGGLLDVLVPRNFQQSGEIIMTLAKAQPNGSGTAVAIAKLDLAKATLTNQRIIFEMTPGSQGDRHFGSRIVEARDGSLFVTIGERGDRPSAQDLSRHNGSIVKITRSGAAATGNPFLDQANAEPEIWSYGHRNPQGMAFDAKGVLWAVEHGARGGDEVNRIRKGANYGWPVIAYGRHYSGQKIGEGTQKQGMEQPAYYWDPSIAPSGMMIYTGDMFPDWRGDIFVGSLKFDYISRLSGANLTETEALKSPNTKRVRDIRQAADGSIWFISDDRGAIYRMSR
ncbi:PQQ-dependent sugar dehydrogenase [Cognatishimia sp. 1_MG-2023]|uniref:PQQ-dependent sugar dehydrogenase n=1 Tax=Cognatishimia sp. 1_MG-2023 TaxID=3062642 RepID=UPI0026E18E5E|nr:PQQ-dependent sugar dehydrogenase [Cognatishimia sp. 1_MG-2023]MDO6727457.1 PQQ-dependent sugar dehydrogenase [Cognatishimia sp. 1_MG-2023]